jgi:hypothetical protein
VSRWADQSGEANDAVQTDPSAQPMLRTVAGQAFVEFDGVASHLSVVLASTGTFDDFTSGFTAFVVARTEMTPRFSAARFLDFAPAYGSLADSVLFVRYGIGDELFYQVYAGPVAGPYVDAPGSVIDGRLALYEVVAQGGAPLALAPATVYLNGRGLATTLTYVPVRRTRLSNLIGRSNWTPDSLIKGDLGEIRVFRGALDERTRQGVEADLRARWGF